MGGVKNVTLTSAAVAKGAGAGVEALSSLGTLRSCRDEQGLGEGATPELVRRGRQEPGGQ